MSALRVVARAMVTSVAIAASACASGPPAPSAIDLGHDMCASCRMVISSTATAAQVVAPGEEPRLFDDLGCLRRGLLEQAPPADAVVFVADHATGAWLRAGQAVFTEVPDLQTPMGSGIVAHRDGAARDGDPVSHGGHPIDSSQFFGRTRP